MHIVQVELDAGTVASVGDFELRFKRCVGSINAEMFPHSPCMHLYMTAFGISAQLHSLADSPAAQL